MSDDNKPNIRLLHIQRNEGESLEDAVKRTILESLGIAPGNAAPTISFDAEGNPVITGNITVNGSLSSSMSIGGDENEPTCKFGDHVDQIHLMFHGLEKQLAGMTQERDQYKALLVEHDAARQMIAELTRTIKWKETNIESLETELSKQKAKTNDVEEQIKLIEETRDSVLNKYVVSDRDKLLDDINQLMQRKETLQEHVYSLQGTIAELMSCGKSARAIILTPAEIQSGSSRVKWAEGLIRQLPETHEGRNSWLMNYGESLPGDSLEQHIHRAGVVEGAVTTAPDDNVQQIANWVIVRHPVNPAHREEYFKESFGVHEAAFLRIIPNEFFTFDIKYATNFNDFKYAANLASMLSAIDMNRPIRAERRDQRVAVQTAIKPTMRMAWVVERDSAFPGGQADFLSKDFFDTSQLDFTPELKNAMKYESEALAKSAIGVLRNSGSLSQLTAYYRPVPL